MTMKISFVVVGVCLLTAAALWVTKIDSDHKAREQMHGPQYFYVEHPFPPLRTNMYLFFVRDKGTVYLYLCNDGQVRWSFKEKL